MSPIRKIGIVLVLVGICLPTATLPFITEFKPVPELCLTSNFFQNMGNMVVVFGGTGMDMSAGSTGAFSPALAFPYRYLFSLGVILTCAGLGMVVLTAGKPSPKNQ